MVDIGLENQNPFKQQVLLVLSKSIINLENEKERNWNEWTRCVLHKKDNKTTIHIFMFHPFSKVV